MERFSALAVGLTGGAASGKSAACEIWRSCGVEIIDADVAARELSAPGEPAYSEIVSAFGTHVVLPDGGLDRRALRQLIFSDAGRRAALEAILHPRIRTRLLQQVRDCAGNYCIVVVPLLVECRADYLWLDQIAVIEASPEIQLKRLVKREGMTPALARAVIAAQASPAQRRALADAVIDNSGDWQALRGACLHWHAHWQELGKLKRGCGQN